MLKDKETIKLIFFAKNWVLQKKNLKWGKDFIKKMSEIMHNYHLALSKVFGLKAFWICIWSIKVMHASKDKKFVKHFAHPQNILVI